MVRRSGTTLVEVLVAIFVMGIGLLALLVLFPLGALRMAQAIQDDRCAHAVVSGDAVATVQNVRTDPVVVVDTSTAPPHDVFLDPWKIIVPPPAPYPPIADEDHASFPVLVDPTGFRAMAGLTAKDWVGGDPASNVRRRPVSFANTPAEIFRFFSLLDDINFATTGYPKVIVAGVPPTIERDTRYTWAYLLQRPRASDPSIVNCSVVVFNRRPLSPNGALSLNEYAYPGVSYFDPSRNVITIDYAGLTPPPVRPGDWVLDSTLDVSNAPHIVPHGFFYRVVGISQISNTVVEFEVQTPLRGFGNTKIVADPVRGYPGTAVVFEGIAEVFERGLGRN